MFDLNPETLTAASNAPNEVPQRWMNCNSAASRDRTIFTLLSDAVLFRCCHFERIPQNVSGTFPAPQDHFFSQLYFAQHLCNNISHLVVCLYSAEDLLHEYLA